MIKLQYKNKQNLTHENQLSNIQRLQAFRPQIRKICHHLPQHTRTSSSSPESTTKIANHKDHSIQNDPKDFLTDRSFPPPTHISSEENMHGY